MKQFFLQITTANIALLLIVTIAGHVVTMTETMRGRFEILTAVIAIFCALVHSVIYTYFIAATKFVERAIDEHGYEDQEAVSRAKTNKRQAFRWAFLAMLATMIAAFVFYWSSPVRDEHAIGRGWSALAAYLAILMNLVAAKNQWKYVVANGVLTDEILACVTPAEEHAGNESNAGERPTGTEQSGG